MQRFLHWLATSRGSGARLVHLLFWLAGASLTSLIGSTTPEIIWIYLGALLTACLCAGWYSFREKLYLAGIEKNSLEYWHGKYRDELKVSEDLRRQLGKLMRDSVRAERPETVKAAAAPNAAAAPKPEPVGISPAQVDAAVKAAALAERSRAADKLRSFREGASNARKRFERELAEVNTQLKRVRGELVSALDDMKELVADNSELTHALEEEVKLLQRSRDNIKALQEDLTTVFSSILQLSTQVWGILPQRLARRQNGPPQSVTDLESCRFALNFIGRCAESLRGEIRRVESASNSELGQRQKGLLDRIDELQGQLTEARAALSEKDGALDEAKQKLLEYSGVPERAILEAKIRTVQSTREMAALMLEMDSNWGPHFTAMLLWDLCEERGPELAQELFGVLQDSPADQETLAHLFVRIAETDGIGIFLKFPEVQPHMRPLLTATSLAGFCDELCMYLRPSALQDESKADRAVVRAADALLAIAGQDRCCDAYRAACNALVTLPECPALENLDGSSPTAQFVSHAADLLDDDAQVQQLWHLAAHALLSKPELYFTFPVEERKNLAAIMFADEQFDALEPERRAMLAEQAVNSGCPAEALHFVFGGKLLQDAAAMLGQLVNPELEVCKLKGDPYGISLRRDFVYKGTAGTLVALRIARRQAELRAQSVFSGTFELPENLLSRWREEVGPRAKLCDQIFARACAMVTGTIQHLTPAVFRAVLAHGISHEGMHGPTVSINGRELLEFLVFWDVRISGDKRHSHEPTGLGDHRIALLHELQRLHHTTHSFGKGGAPGKPRRELLPIELNPVADPLYRFSKERGGSAGTARLRQDLQGDVDRFKGAISRVAASA